jgi:putative transposase
MLNVMDAVSKKEQVQAKSHLNAMMYAESRQQALKERKKFEQAFGHNPKAVKTVVENWDRLTTYYDFPREHWKHLRTSNVVESPFSRVRLRTAASRRFKSRQCHLFDLENDDGSGNEFQKTQCSASGRQSCRRKKVR